MTDPDLSEAIESLGTATTGPVLLPGDDGYSEACEIWNSRLQRYPSVVLQCHDAEDVSHGVSFAVDTDLELTVMGGGHDYAGKSACDDGFLLDLSPMDSVTVDAQAQRATVGAGATWADVDAATEAEGLMVPGPTVSTVGVAGATLGGGQGHFSRKFGLTADNVRSVEIVTADGQIRRASSEEHEDLFWAIRGGLGAVGVVTEFEFELHEAGPEVLGGQAMHPIDDIDDVLRFYREYVADLPEEAMCYAFVIPIPPLEAFPEELHGEPAITLVAAHLGPESAAEETIDPLREFGDPYVADFNWMPYTALQTMFDDGVPKGLRWYSRSVDLPSLSDATLDTFADFGRDLHGPFSMAYFVPMDGAMSDPDTADTAFGSRESRFTFHILCGWQSDERDDEMMSWTRSFYDAMSSESRESVYVNLLGEDEEDRAAAAYGPNYDRLVELVDQWDPDGIFDETHPL